MRGRVARRMAGIVVGVGLVIAAGCVPLLSAERADVASGIAAEALSLDAPQESPAAKATALAPASPAGDVISAPSAGDDAAPNVVAEVAAGRALPGRAPSQIKVTGGTAKQRTEVRKYLKKWARFTNINEVAIRNSLSRTGLATLYSDGSATIELRKSVGTGARLRYTMLHEIAHAQAVYVYNGNLGVAERTFKAKFGGIKRPASWKGLEAAADCGAHYMSGTKANLYYKPGGCSAAQRNTAKMIAQGYQV